MPDRIPVDYETRLTQSQSFGRLRVFFAAFGLFWFTAMSVLAIFLFIVRDMFDEPGAPMTIRGALAISAVCLGIGAPGLLVAIIILVRTSATHHGPRQD